MGDFNLKDYKKKSTNAEINSKVKLRSNQELIAQEVMGNDDNNMSIDTNLRIEHLRKGLTGGLNNIMISTTRHINIEQKTKNKTRNYEKN